MERAFSDIFGKLPDPQVRNVLDRMPGLTWADQPGTRRFIDEQFFGAAQAGAVVEFVTAPHNADIEPHRHTQQCISSLASRVAYERISREGVTSGATIVAIEVASQAAGRE